MKPGFFKERNTNIQRPGKKDIPAFRNSSKEGELVLRWKLNLIERLRVLFTGDVWSCVITHNKPYRQMLMTTKKKDVLLTEKVKPQLQKLRKVA